MPVTPWPYRLAVRGVHAGLDLRVDPQRAPLPHGAEQEGLEVEEHLVVPVPVARRLVGDDGGKVPVPAPAHGALRFSLCQVSVEPPHPASRAGDLPVGDEGDAAEHVRVVRIRGHGHLHQLEVLPGCGMARDAFERSILANLSISHPLHGKGIGVDA